MSEEPQITNIQQPSTTPPKKDDPALVFGVLSLVFATIFPISIAALVLGIVGINKKPALAPDPTIKPPKTTGQILSIIGTVLGAFGLIVKIIAVIFLLWFAAAFFEGGGFLDGIIDAVNTDLKGIIDDNGSSITNYDDPACAELIDKYINESAQNNLTFPDSETLKCLEAEALEQINN